MRGKYPSKKIRKLFGVTVSRAQSGAERRFFASVFHARSKNQREIVSKSKK